MDSGHSVKRDALPKTSAAIVRTEPVVDNLDTLFPMLERVDFVTDPTVLAATWSDGVFVFAGETRQQEVPGQSVPALTPDGHRGAFRYRRWALNLPTGFREGSWSTIATHDSALSCCVTVGKAF